MSLDNDDLWDDTSSDADGGNHPGVQQLLSLVQQQQASAQQGYESLQAAIAELVSSLPTEVSGEMSVEVPEEEPQLPPALPQATPVASPVAAGAAIGDSAWASILLGSELASDPHVGGECQRLMSGLSHGEVGATGLVGHLLIFRSSPPDKMPKLLKEVGEAYYRWSPHSDGPAPLRDALIGWLERVCEACGIHNKIRVVQTGDRFDATRHSAKERGIEIGDVFGWIVLRDNGKVFSKATVAVK